MSEDQTPLEKFREVFRPEEPLEFTGSPEAVAKLMAEFAEAAGEWPDIAKDTQGQIGYQKFSYAPIATIMKAVRPALAKHGIAILHPISWSPRKEGYHRITTILAGHGAMMISKLDFDPKSWLSEGGEKEKKDDAIKVYGKHLTYIRRYCLQSMLGIEGDRDADDDSQSVPRGDSANGRPKQAVPARPQQAPPPRQEARPAPRQEAPRQEALPPPPTNETRVVGEVTLAQNKRIRQLLVLLKIPSGKLTDLFQKWAGCLPEDLDNETAEKVIIGLEDRCKAELEHVPPWPEVA